MGTDTRWGGGISTPGVVKTYLEKIMSKMTPMLKLFLLWEQGLTRSAPEGFAPGVILWLRCVHEYVYTYILVMEYVSPYVLLLAHPLRVLNIHRLNRIWKKWHLLQEKNKSDIV